MNARRRFNTATISRFSLPSATRVSLALARAVVVGVALALFVPAVAQSALQRGDLNQDGTIGAADIVLLERHLSGESLLVGDALLLADVAPITPGPDGLVETGDLVVLLRLAGEEASLAAPPAAPVVTSVVPHSGQGPIPNANPVDVTGTAPGASRVELFVEGEAQWSDDGGTGAFTIPAFLFDGDNTIEVRAIGPGGISDFSAPVVVSYVNNINRQSLPAQINDLVVWTNGDGAGGTETYPITQTLQVRPGAPLTGLVIQPGVELQFDSSAMLRVIRGGQLHVRGRAAMGEKVTFTRTGGPLGSGTWGGIDADSEGFGLPTVDIEHAIIEYASAPLRLDNVATARVVSSSILNFSGIGINILSQGQVEVLNNVFSNVPRTGVAIDIGSNSGATALIAGNTITGMSAGLFVRASGNVPRIVGNTIGDSGTGIEVLGGSALIEGNTIQGNAKGITVSGSLVHADIYKNDVSGNGTPGEASTYGIAVFGQATATVHYNSITSNGEPGLPRDIWASQDPSTPIGIKVVDARFNWWGTDEADQVRATGDGENASVDYSHFLGSPFDPGATGAPGPIPTGGLAFTNLLFGVGLVGGDEGILKPTLAGTPPVEVEFELVGPAAISVEFYNEREYNDYCGAGNPCPPDPAALSRVRTISLPAGGGTLPAGVHSEPWDGFDDASLIVPDEAYVFVVRGTVGGRTHVAGPAEKGGASAVLRSEDLEFSPYENDFWNVTFELLQAVPSRVSGIANPGPDRNDLHEDRITWLDDAPYPSGLHTIAFDGRRTEGTFLLPDETQQLYVALLANGQPDPMFGPMIFVQETAPSVTGSPEIFVKPEPYLIYNSYDQSTSIPFCLSQNAIVTLSISRIFDDSGGTVIEDVLDQPVNNQAMAATTDCVGAPHVVEWNGEDEQTPGTILSPAEGLGDGVYTFTITASSALSGQSHLTSTYRGVLQVRH